MARRASTAGEIETAEAASTRGGKGGCGEGRRREGEATGRSSARGGEGSRQKSRRSRDPEIEGFRALGARYGGGEISRELALQAFPVKVLGLILAWKNG
jgi:hypothetical protein